jgi:hypothetical protein
MCVDVRFWPKADTPVGDSRGQLSGVKRTFPFDHAAAAFDPKRTCAKPLLDHLVGDGEQAAKRPAFAQTGWEASEATKHQSFYALLMRLHRHSACSPI